MAQDIIHWSIEGLHKGNAQKCYNECQTLDAITPENVLNKARNKRTELHKCFEWDDTIASEKYRLQQAKDIIRHFVIITPETEDSEPIKLRTFQITTKPNTYEHTQIILQQPDEYQALLNRAKRELLAFKKRYQTLTELDIIFDAIDDIISSI